MEAAIYIWRPPFIYGGRHLLYRGRHLLYRGRHLLYRGRQLENKSRPPFIYRGRHLYIEAAIYISRPPVIYRGRNLYIEASIYISRPQFTISRPLLRKLNGGVHLLSGGRHIYFLPGNTAKMYFAAANYVVAFIYVVVTGNFF